MRCPFYSIVGPGCVVLLLKKVTSRFGGERVLQSDPAQNTNGLAVEECLDRSITTARLYFRRCLYRRRAQLYTFKTIHKTYGTKVAMPLMENDSVDTLNASTCSPHVLIATQQFIRYD